MIVLIAFLVLVLSIVTFVVTLRAGIYRRVPLEHYALMGTSTGLALYAVVRDPSWVSITVLCLSLSGLSLLVWYIHFEAVFPRGGIRLKVGQRFPKFTLPDSEGGIFDSHRLAGDQSALYLFYRGHW